MPHRTKDEAQLRMAIGVARVTALKGGDARDGLVAIQQHLTNVKTLEEPPSSSDNPEDQPTVHRRLTE